ncbi:unnamed protein product [Brachionus calyciflorus]|uniref:Chitin-binding type-2 domain-containing protein n=1 Tax=Brachionus calyciflorus TaxID=104777 RepID=A0A813P686_9BILA|nr:unnamed protein product [Brachionus calyciflorus]
MKSLEDKIMIFLVFCVCILIINAEPSSLNETKSLNLTTLNSRCPPSAPQPGVYLFSDKKLCNVYHECECVSANSSFCTQVRTNVCPVGTIFLNTTNKCEPIEMYGCDTSYLQSLNIGSTNSKNKSLERDYEKPMRGGGSKDLRDSKLEPVNVTGITGFQCPQGANDRYADSEICNLFHVCVSRGDQTFDQPFLCPFSTIFRVIDSSTMYCDKRNKNDCSSKAFYKSLDEDDLDLIDKSLLINTNSNSTECLNTNEIVEDKQFCNLYHVCRDGKDMTYMCENQLLFNPLSQICDYPINVICYNKKIFKIQDKDKYFSSSLSLPSSPVSQKILSNKTLSNYSLLKRNGSQIQIYNVKLSLNCPRTELKNYVLGDRIFCNVYHQCYGNSGMAFVCEKNLVYDSDKLGACTPEEFVDCSGKLILTEGAQKPGKSYPRFNVDSENNINNNNKQINNYLNNNYVAQGVANSREELIMGIPFDCRGRSNGHWRDGKFCDVYHACLNNEQKKTYSCAQLGEKTYYDEETKRCEFLKNNPLGCPSNSFFQSMTKSSPNSKSLVSDEPSEGWRQFIRSRESFSCVNRLDGFYASRWCNVFYRCFLGSKTEFLCPKMLNSDRLWWVQHGSSQEVPQTSAACVWPCETKNKCQSPGGSIIEVGNGKYDESQNEAEKVWRNSNCAGNSGLTDVFKLSDQESNNCQGQPEGAFFASKYCNIFHRCTNGKRKDFQCPKATNTPYDLWWNDEKSQCDWPCKIQCNKPIYGSQKTSQQIQNEDRNLNEEECRLAMKKFESPKKNFIITQTNPTTFTTTTSTSTSTSTPMQTTTTTQVRIESKQILGTMPDENFFCRNIGLGLSPKYCNVYYDCKQYGQIPNTGYYCLDGFFDPMTKSCKLSAQVQCPYNPQLVYPFVALVEQTSPEDIKCSNSIGSYIIHSNKFCNIYYVCDGRSTKPIVNRCYDRVNLEDGVFNRELRRCEAKNLGICEGEILPMKLKYQSSPLDHTKYSDLQALSCRNDQQYLAEHDKYCNLYHSCILGKYQMYACVTLGSFDKTSYFYYTNGDCAAPNSAQCAPNKAIYPYEKLFPNEKVKYTPVISPSLNYKGQASLSSVSIKVTLPYTPVCSLDREKYLIPHSKFCNVFYECVHGKLSTFACIDSTTGLFSGVFDPIIRACKPFNRVDCPSNQLFTPEFDSGLSYNQVKYQADYSFKTESNFSCVDKINGYYESEWCNVFYRCVNGKRIDAKCSSGNTHSGDYLFQYDLWWEHQNSTYNPMNPLIFTGPDEDAKCEWPCKVKCEKPVWLEKGKSQPSKLIQNHDFELHPECFNSNEKIYKDEEVVNFHKINEYQAQDMDTVNPSGFYCETDGTFRDPIYCNLFHVCNGKEKKTYQCKPLNSHETVSIFDQEKGYCVSKDDGFSKCNGVLFDPNFMNLPAYRDLPTPLRPCLESGVFRAFDKDAKYCDLYYWCEKSFSEPLYFYCDYATYGREPAYFNFDTKQCESSYTVRCDPPNKVYSGVAYQNKVVTENKNNNNNVKKDEEKIDTETVLKNFLQASPYMMQIVSGLLDPAPGYLSLPSSQFQTNFKCPLNAPGYYPNSEFCDIFHYCYSNGQFKTYVCASMQNQYQLWWSHQTEPGRRDNIFCDWPCNLIGPNTVCPSHKRVLMRDRQQISGGISQQDVLATTCQNTQAAHNHMINNNWGTERSKSIPVMNTETFVPLSQKSNQKPVVPTSNPTVTVYPPCTIGNEWFSSPQVIRCSNDQRMFGFAPDPKDCTKFYRCDQAVSQDGTSTGSLYSCIAGLYWDQTKRMCVHPTESSCNPLNVINSQSNKLSGQSCPSYTCSQIGLSLKNQMKSINGKPNSYFKCDGQCALEMMCPFDLVFDNLNQRCEWLTPQFRMASLRASDKLNTLLQQQMQQQQQQQQQEKSNLDKPLVVENIVKAQSNETLGKI